MTYGNGVVTTYAYRPDIRRLLKPRINAVAGMSLTGGARAKASIPEARIGERGRRSRRSPRRPGQIACSPVARGAPRQAVRL
jgi:hypothetical protein